MKHKLPRFQIFLLLILAATFPISAVEIGGINYSLNESTLTAKVDISTSFVGDCVIPSSVTYEGKSYVVTEIGLYAFRACNGLTSVVIGNSVTTIAHWAFAYCGSLTSVVIGNSVNYIDNAAFQSCKSLTSINVDSSNLEYASVDGCLYDKSVTELIQCPGGKKSVSIPSSVTAIYESSFAGCTNLASINVDSGNPKYASVDGVLCDKSVATLFKCPEGKMSVTIPNTITAIRNRAFYGCSSLASVTIPNSVITIGSEAFAYCRSLASATIPNSVTRISDSAFYGCSSLVSVTIPNSVITIGSKAFYECGSLASVTIPNSVITIGSEAFYWCGSLASVTIPNSVITIGSKAFYECSNLASVIIGNSVTDIGRYVFYSCDNLSSVTIGSSVTNIGYCAFWGCRGLVSVTSLNVVPPLIDDITFYGFKYQDAKLHVPEDGFAAYKDADGWKNFINIDTQISGVEDVSASNAAEAMEYYNLQGMRSTVPWTGLNIVIYSNGTTRKMLYKE